MAVCLACYKKAGKSNIKRCNGLAARINVQHLVLAHFSSRYDDQPIIRSIQEPATSLALACSIHVVLPGAVNRNILEKYLRKWPGYSLDDFTFLFGPAATSAINWGLIKSRPQALFILSTR